MLTTYWTNRNIKLIKLMLHLDFLNYLCDLYHNFVTHCTYFEISIINHFSQKILAMDNRNKIRIFIFIAHTVDKPNISMNFKQINKQTSVKYLFLNLHDALSIIDREWCYYFQVCYYYLVQRCNKGLFINMSVSIGDRWN